MHGVYAPTVMTVAVVSLSGSVDLCSNLIITNTTTWLYGATLPTTIAIVFHGSSIFQSCMLFVNYNIILLVIWQNEKLGLEHLDIKYLKYER